MIAAPLDVHTVGVGALIVQRGDNRSWFMFDRDIAALRHIAPRANTRVRFALALATTGGILLTVSAPSAAAGGRGCPHARTPVTAASRAELRTAVVCLINRQRTDRGLPALRTSRRLNRSAQGWTNAMVSHGHFSHGADFAARISAVGFDWSTVGENIATGSQTPAAVVRAWMASTGHCQNILSPAFSAVGTGVSDRSIAGSSNQAGTWTQDFGLPIGAHAPSSTAAPASGCPY